MPPFLSRISPALDLTLEEMSKFELPDDDELLMVGWSLKECTWDELPLDADEVIAAFPTCKRLLEEVSRMGDENYRSLEVKDFKKQEVQYMPAGMLRYWLDVHHILKGDRKYGAAWHWLWSICNLSDEVPKLLKCKIDCNRLWLFLKTAGSLQLFLAFQVFQICRSTI